MTLIRWPGAAALCMLHVCALSTLGTVHHRPAHLLHRYQDASTPYFLHSIVVFPANSAMSCLKTHLASACSLPDESFEHCTEACYLGAPEPTVLLFSHFASQLPKVPLPLCLHHHLTMLLIDMSHLPSFRQWSCSLFVSYGRRASVVPFHCQGIHQPTLTIPTPPLFSLTLKH